MNRKRFVVFLSVLLLTGLVPTQGQFRGPQRELVAEIERVMLQWRNGMRSMDAGGVADLYAEDAIRIFQFATGLRHIVAGREPIAEHQAAEFRAIRREHPDNPRPLAGFALPEPEFLFLPDHLPIVVYRSEDANIVHYFHLDEHEGRLVISRQVEIILEVEPIEAGEAYRWADEDQNGVLEPVEQRLVLEQYLSFARGPHRAEGVLDNWFDWNGDLIIDERETERALTVLYRDGLRQGFRFFPEFAHHYADVDDSGAVTIPEAEMVMEAAFDLERELPRPVDGPVDERMDVDLDGWIIPLEREALVFALTRSVASIPGLPLTTPDTPGEAEWIAWWTDANEDGLLSEQEYRDVGTILVRAMTSTEIVSNPIEVLFDRDGDHILSEDERQQASRAVLRELPSASRERLLQVARQPERLIGAIANSDLTREMDSDPRDGRIEAHEVWGFLESRFQRIAAQWFEETHHEAIEVVEISPAQNDPETAADSGLVGDTGEATTGTGSGTTVAVRTERRLAPVDQVGDELSIALSLNPVYPVLRKFYDTSPVGTVTITNTSSHDLSDLEVTFAVSNYTDLDRSYDEIATLSAGESASVDLTLLLNSTALSITEGDRVDATVYVSYRGAEGEGEETATETLIFYDRNAIRWDDTRRVAAFVTERDEEIRGFARRTIASTRNLRNDAVDDALQDAMVLFTAMAESDLMYFLDPSSSYASASSSGTTIDYVQFPRETFAYYGGDCDDLSVCFNALLESVGRRTAFITVPGHIMPAVALTMGADEARNAFLDATDLVFDATGTVWVPVEITALEDSFYEAWQDAAKTYRQYSGSDQVEVIPTSAAWELYESVQSVLDDEVDAPDSDTLETEFGDALNEFVNTQIATRELRYQADLQDRPGDRRLLNRLGVLYAQYGLWDKARTQFEAIVESEEYIPALLNLGHIEFLDENHLTASQYYDRVLLLNSDHPGALLAAARAHHERENYGNVRTYYEQLRSLSPRLAADHSYLDLSSSNDAERAQAAGVLRKRVTWEIETEDESAGQ